MNDRVRQKTKWLVLFALFFSATAASHATSNRVFENLTSLREMGFSFVMHRQESKGVISLSIMVPEKFNTGNETGVKPFHGISLMRTLRKVDHGPGLISAEGSHFPILSQVTEAGAHQSSVTLMTSDAERSYIEVCYRYDQSVDWPMLVHIPVSMIIRELKTAPPAAAPELKTKSNQTPGPGSGTEEI